MPTPESYDFVAWVSHRKTISKIRIARMIKGIIYRFLMDTSPLSYMMSGNNFDKFQKSPAGGGEKFAGAILVVKKDLCVFCALFICEEKPQEPKTPAVAMFFGKGGGA